MVRGLAGRDDETGEICRGDGCEAQGLVADATRGSNRHHYRVVLRVRILQRQAGTVGHWSGEDHSPGVTNDSWTISDAGDDAGRRTPDTEQPADAHAGTARTQRRAKGAARRGDGRARRRAAGKRSARGSEWRSAAGRRV